MKDLLGFDFYTDKDGAPLELDPDYGPEYSQLYKQKVCQLAQDIAQVLKTLQAEDARARAATGTRSTSSAARQTGGVSCGMRLRPKAARELLEGELKRLGYPVLPDKRLPVDEAEYVHSRAEPAWRAARSRSISWGKGTAPCPMVRPTGRPA